MAPEDSGTQKINVQNTGSLEAWVHIKDFGKTGDLLAGSNPLLLTNTEVFKIPANSNRDFNITYNLPKGAGNEYQAKVGSVSINFEAVQVANNPNQGQLWGQPANNNSHGINIQNSSFNYTYGSSSNTWSVLSLLLCGMIITIRLPI